MDASVLSGPLMESLRHKRLQQRQQLHKSSSSFATRLHKLRFRSLSRVSIQKSNAANRLREATNTKEATEVRRQLQAEPRTTSGKNDISSTSRQHKMATSQHHKTRFKRSSQMIVAYPTRPSSCYQATLLATIGLLLTIVQHALGQHYQQQPQYQFHRQLFEPSHFEDQLRAQPQLLSQAQPSQPSLSQLPPPTPHLHQRQLIVPGTSPREQEDQTVTQVVLPYESYRPNATQDLGVSYIIDHKRFVEAVSTRCFASTLMEDPLIYEPSFVIISPMGERRLNATAPAEFIRQAGFNPSKGTTIIIHGFTQSYPSTDWLRRTRALFEKHALVGHHNLIIMDWGIGSHGSYSQVAARVSGMGSFLANFLMKLVADLGTDRMKIHIIGHSLGAHLAGFAGKRMRPRIGRITALDPAGPCFGKFFSNSPMDRLSPDDAFEVDVYHYDDGFLGLPGQHGQFDVYVNGGSSQPGCRDNINSILNALVTMVLRRNRVLSESHTRSTEVATSQLSISGCQQVAYECRDFAAFLSGECGKCDENNQQCFFMGFPHQYADSDIHMLPLRTAFPSKQFYILTGVTELYCAHHYQILVKFEPTPEMSQLAKRNKWYLQLELINDTQARVNVTITNQMAPNVFSYLLLTDSRPMRVTGAVLRVTAADGSPVALRDAASGSPKASKSQAFRVLSIEANFMSHINPQARRSLSSRLCPVPSGWIGQDINSIADSSSPWLTTPESGLQFEECFA